MTRIFREPVQQEVVIEETNGGAVARAWSRFLMFWVSMAAVVVEVLLAFRVGLLAAEANPRQNFVDLIYDVTGPLIQPFQGIIASRTLDNGGIFEPASAFAMGIYFIATVLVLWALWGAAAMTPLSSDDDVVVGRRTFIH